MTKAVCRALPVIAAASVIAIASTVAMAQDPGQPFKTNYFSNNTIAGAPHGFLRITNDGALAGTEQAGGDLCAMVYVYAADQQLTECCGCLVTPNGLRTADIHTNLTNNPLTGGVPNNGVVQVITSKPNSTGSPTATTPDNSPYCDPTANGILPPFSTVPVIVPGSTPNTFAPVTPFPDLREWTTHIQRLTPAAGFAETETENSPAFLNPSEYLYVTTECYFATVLLGSGSAVCDCGTEM